MVDILNSSYKDKRLFNRYITDDIRSFLDNNLLVYFFEDRNLFPPDADCTAIILGLLVESNRIRSSETLNAVKIISQNTDENGVIRAFIGDKKHLVVDPCVCANVLYFLELLKQSHLIQKSENFLIDFLSSEKYLNGTRYYPSPYTFLYFTGRLMAFDRTREIFAPLLRVQLDKLLDKEKNAIELAKFLIVAKWCGYKIPNVHEHISKLISMADEKGKWPATTFFSFGSKRLYFGSSPLTTAFAMGALTAHLKSQ